MHDRPPGGHVVVQLVRAHAVAVDAQPLPAEEGGVAGPERGADGGLGYAPEQMHARDLLRGEPLPEGGAVGPISPQQDRHAAALQQRHRRDEVVHRIRHAEPAGVRDDEPAGGAQVGDQVGVRLRQRLAGAIELLDRDAIRDVDEARALQPARDEVVVGRRQDRDDRVGMPAGVALGAAHRGDERVARRDASQLDRRERPQVVHLEHQPRVRARRDRPRAVDVERMRRRRDDDVGPEAARESPAVRAQQRRECRDVEGAAGAVARVRREPEPLEVDALDALTRDGPAQPGVARAHVRRRTGHDQRLVARHDPFAREHVRPELHAVNGRARVLVDHENPVRPGGHDPAGASSRRSRASTSANSVHARS